MKGQSKKEDDVSQRAEQGGHFKIILRYGLDPFNALDENLRRLETFVVESATDEVMFLLRPEERSSGHPTIAQAEPWVAAIQQARSMLSAHGVAISINPWTTTYHCSRGRRLHEGQDFRLMVGETGVDNGMTACPLCVNWQRYLAEYFCYLTREIEPVALWIEDDWRLHNHGGEMGYGGCFCESCLERFRKRVGEEATREQVVQRVVQPGQPHPWRAAWLDVARAALHEPAEVLAAALKAERPNMRLGLMTSIPDIHSIEGRDWQGLMDVWRGDDERYLVRPHMPPYTEEPPITTTPSYSRHTIANLDRDADIYPELENSPRCGPYSGTHAYTAWQMRNAVCFGSRGITINHFDNMGMNTFYDRAFGQSLARERPSLDALTALRIDDRKARGVKVLFSPEIARHRQTGAGTAAAGAKLYTGEDLSGVGGGSLQDLEADSSAWSKVFYALGISHGFTRRVEGDAEALFAVSDQTLRCFDDDAIGELLRHAVILDLPSTEILVERGFGELIGVESVKRCSLQSTAYSIEEVREDVLGPLAGGVRPRMCAQRCADPIGALTYAPGVRVLSDALTADLDPLFPLSGIFENRLGGRVYTCGYTLGKAQFYMAYFNVLRQRYWTELLFALGGAAAGQVVAGGHPLQVHASNTEQGLFCAVTNVVYDTAEGFTLTLPATDVEGRSVYHLNASAEWVRVEPAIAVSDGVAELSLNLQIPTLRSACLLFRRA